MRGFGRSGFGSATKGARRHVLLRGDIVPTSHGLQRLETMWAVSVNWGLLQKGVYRASSRGAWG